MNTELTAKEIANATMELYGTARKYAKDGNQLIALQGFALGYSVVKIKSPDYSWSELEEDLVQLVRDSFANAKAEFMDASPHG